MTRCVKRRYFGYFIMTRCVIGPVSCLMTQCVKVTRRVKVEVGQIASASLLRCWHAQAFAAMCTTMTAKMSAALQPITLYLPSDMVSEIDRRVDEAQKRRPSIPMSRGTVVREMLAHGMRDRSRVKA